jgi:peptidoglycan hydrolase CwlO-like protein
MSKKTHLLAILLFAFFSVTTVFLRLFASSQAVIAAEDCTCPADQDELECNKAKQACWQEKIGQTHKQADTLANIISTLNGQIVVQELQIKQTQIEIDRLVKEIGMLGDRISGLNVSLDHLTQTLILRVRASYKRRHTNPIGTLMISNSFDDFFMKYKYLEVTQKHTTELMKQAEAQKIDFDQQKALKEKKQQEVDQKRKLLQQQQDQLAQQRADQQTLLAQTKNDEKHYQQELAETLAELKAIQSIVAGQGSESKVRDVKQGEEIASIIAGPSACSTGAHLHFEVVKDGAHQNPAGYLKSISGLIWSNDPDGPFDFSGDWDWPLNNPARINQGYGMTWYARVRRSYGGAPHTGIDMVSKTAADYTVKAVKEGVLYRGSIKCGGGFLRYVKVQHKDSNLSSFYLHVNY